MSILNWAKKEVEIACKRENPDRKEGGFDYGCACYESALKAFDSLCQDGHSGSSIKMTQAILNRLIDGKPLTPIEDTENVWNLVSSDSTGPVTYQCKRMSSLFKDVYADGSVKYEDINHSYGVNIHNPNSTYHSGLVSSIIHDMYPITMPYMPGDPIAVYCEDFLVDPKNGDFDTVGAFYALVKENGTTERIEINRFFREPMGDEEGSWTEITKEEYEDRKTKKVK